MKTIFILFIFISGIVGAIIGLLALVTYGSIAMFLNGFHVHALWVNEYTLDAALFGAYFFFICYGLQTAAAGFLVGGIICTIVFMFMARSQTHN